MPSFFRGDSEIVNGLVLVSAIVVFFLWLDWRSPESRRHRAVRIEGEKQREVERLTKTMAAEQEKRNQNKGG